LFSIRHIVVLKHVAQIAYEYVIIIRFAKSAARNT